MGPLAIHDRCHPCRHIQYKCSGAHQCIRNGRQSGRHTYRHCTQWNTRGKRRSPTGQNQYTRKHFVFLYQLRRNWHALRHSHVGIYQRRTYSIRYPASCAEYRSKSHTFSQRSLRSSTCNRTFPALSRHRAHRFHSHGHVAIDSQGNVWAPSSDDNGRYGCVLKLSLTGKFLSGATGFSGGTLSIVSATPGAIAIDLMDNAWISNFSQIGNNVTKLDPGGAILSGPNGFVIDNGTSGPWQIAIDSLDNAWVANPDETTVSRLSNSGTLLTGSSGFTGYMLSTAIDGSGNIWGYSWNQFSNPSPIIVKLDSNGVAQSGAGYPIARGSARSFAIDHQGNLWVPLISADFSSSIIKMNNSGTVVSGPSGYTDNSLILPTNAAIDGLGHIWIGNSGGVVEMDNNGAFLSGPSGYLNQSTGSGAIAVDGSGNVWTSDYVKDRIEQLVGVAAPVVTPLALGVKNNTLGTRP